jgi:hypothetical protein
MAYASKTQQRQARSTGGETSKVSSEGVTVMKTNKGADTSSKGFYGRVESADKARNANKAGVKGGNTRKFIGKVK